MVKKKTAKSRNINKINVLDNNNIRITLIVCATALIIFLSYNFIFSDYARCMSLENEKTKNYLKKIDFKGDKEWRADEIKEKKHRAKNQCVRLTSR